MTNKKSSGHLVMQLLLGHVM